MSSRVCLARVSELTTCQHPGAQGTFWARVVDLRGGDVADCGALVRRHRTASWWAQRPHGRVPSGPRLR